MTAPIGKACKEPRCTALVFDRGQYCAKHKQTGFTGWAAPEREAKKSKLYSTRAWQRCRMAKLAQSPMCERCKRVPASEVHHTARAQIAPEQFYQSENLEALCRKCHAKETARESAESRKRTKGDA